MLVKMVYGGDDELTNGRKEGAVYRRHNRNTNTII